MQCCSLDQWLDSIRTSHASIIDYSLERITCVAKHLDILQPNIPVITVAGTNGKGSTVHTMEAILKTAHYRVGVFTSPHLETYNEQIRIDGHHVTDTQLTHAFSTIYHASLTLTISLTEFEFLTLAALLIFKQSTLDMIILEVGLGGGNDAVAIIKPQITVITSIALDHQEYLGHTIDAIAASEAQLLPTGKIGIIGLQHPPKPIIDHAEKINTTLLCLDYDFYPEQQPHHWTFKNSTITYSNLPYPKILIRNAALAIQALLSAQIIFSETQLQTALRRIVIKGRLQLIKGTPSYLIDVSHNIEGVTQLANQLSSYKNQKIVAVFSAFSDKSIATLIALINPFVDYWIIAPIEHPRAASLHQLLTAFDELTIDHEKISIHHHLNTAFQEAENTAESDTIILAFGSFFVARHALTHAQS